MHLSENRKSGRLTSNRLPKRFPVGATYVVEGRGGEDGKLRVFSRYVVLPSGERINIGGDFTRPARSRNRRQARNRREAPASAGNKTRSTRTKKIVAAGGTTRRHGR